MLRFQCKKCLRMHSDGAIISGSSELSPHKWLATTACCLGPQSPAGVVMFGSTE